MKCQSKSFIILLSLFISACALSPQTIDIRPSVELSNSADTGKGRTVAVTVVDDRKSAVIGTRGGVYASTSEIRTSDDIKTPIRDELANRLRELGFVVMDSAESADATLKLIVDSIEYAASGEPVVRSVETAATMRVIAKVKNREYTGRYRGTRTTDVLTAPDVEDNEAMINAAVSRVLERLLTDVELHAFLRS